MAVLNTMLLKWKDYVNDIFCYIKIGSVNGILNKLNGFHQKMQFTTYNLEKDNKLAFFNFLLIRDNDTIETRFLLTSIFDELKKIVQKNSKK